jgi:hypothetical protein
MATTKRHEGESARKSRAPSANRASAARRAAESVEPTKPFDSAIDTIFRNDGIVRESLTKNVRERSAGLLLQQDRADQAFDKFTASRYREALRKQRTYLAPGDDLAESLERVMVSGAKELGGSKVDRSIRLRVTDDLRSMVKKKARGQDKSLVGTIGLERLVDYLSPDARVRPTQPPDTTFTSCMAEIEAEKRLAALKAAADAAAKHGNGTKPAANTNGTDGGRAESHANGKTDAAKDALVASDVDLLMKTISSPESTLQYAAPDRQDGDALQKSIDTFELRSGPSDVTSYHDFTSLQIAFEDVWTEVFDGQLETLGKELYSKYVELKDFAGIKGKDRPISSVDDIKALMEEVRSLAAITRDATPREVRPCTPKTGTNGTSGRTPADDAVDSVKSILDPLGLITGTIGDATVHALVDPLGAAISGLSNLFAGKTQLTWGAFPGPLPGHGDIITTTFETNVTEPGTVEIAIKNSPEAWWWKGLEFREFDSSGNVAVYFRISNDPNDSDVWDRTSYNVLPLYTPQLTNGLLEFKKAAPPPFGFGIHTGYYLLAGLDQQLKDGMRVTFTWVKDS